MTDLWSFLLQTLTLSGAAALLLLVKALFRDKLPPKWHFAVWGILGCLTLLPTGLGGRYTLIRWALPIEVIKGLVGDYGFTRVLFPVPLVLHAPKTVADWLFVLYAAGVVASLARYVFSYLRLRRLLHRGGTPTEEQEAHIRGILREVGVNCPIRTLRGLPAPFVCGVIRPVMAIPEGELPEAAVILHEALHLRYRDTLWSVVICLLRCLHWCNPLLVHCAHQATNDMESRCDAGVLARLTGEDRREYGRLLLSMANERFARIPGTTCVNNGGKHLRERIEAIARYKRYPVGMGLVSVCIALLLALPLAVGAQAVTVYENGSPGVALASARTVPCTTPAGAMDTYAKAVITGNGYYRVMCAPEGAQAALAAEIAERSAEGLYMSWDSGLGTLADPNGGYYIYNLTETSDTAFRSLLVLPLMEDGETEEGHTRLAVRSLRVEKEKGRWVVTPEEDFRYITAPQQNLSWGCLSLPAVVYEGVAAQMRAEVLTQTVHYVDNRVSRDNDWFLGSTSYFDTTPKPSAVFTSAERVQFMRLTHLGEASEREEIYQVGLSIAPVMTGESRPEALAPAVHETYAYSSNNHGADWASIRPPSGWGPELEFSSGGSSFDARRVQELPAYYAADLYLNDALAAEITLTLREVEK